MAELEGRVAVVTGSARGIGEQTALKLSDAGMAGLEELDRVLALASSQIPAGRIMFSPRMVRGLSYYNGPIWELVAAGVPGSIGGGGRYDHLIEQLGGPDVHATGTSLGIERILMLLPDEASGRPGPVDVAVTILGDDLAEASFALAAQARGAGLRASVYLGSSGKLGKQLRWAADLGAHWCLIYGNAERQAGTVTVRDLLSAEQEAVPFGEVAEYLAARAVTDA